MSVKRAIASRPSRHPAHPRARYPAVDAQGERPVADAQAAVAAVGRLSS